jgi:glycosyltransferase involved in cell wall biosynthesis
MKIAILSHFGSFQDGYALHVGWLARARLLDYFKQDFDFLVDSRCSTDIYPHMVKNLVPPHSNDFKEKVDFYTNQYKTLLKDYDAILTPDLIYQKNGNFLCWNQAIRNAAPELKAHWYHWIHSSWINPPKNPQYPDSLRYNLPPKSTIVYMNKSERQGVAKMYNCSIDDVACIYNPKDFREFNDFHPLSWKITKLLNFYEKDAIQILPHCATRMDSKGLDSVINVFASLKRKGLKVALVFANANASRVQSEIMVKKSLATSKGLIENEDFVFTSDLNENRPLPRKAVSDIYKLANLFVFASYSEVSPNVELEAKISGNLLVLSNRLPSLAEFGGAQAMYFDASFRTPGIQSGDTGDLQLVNYHPTEDDYFNELVDKVIPRLPDRSGLWEFSYEKIWYEQFKPLLLKEGEK